MSRYSSASTLGPLSIARPEPSKIRPSMSSDTPSFKLCPVNSIRVLSPNQPYALTIIDGVPAHLLHIDTSSALEDLSTNGQRSIVALRQDVDIPEQSRGCLGKKVSTCSDLQGGRRSAHLGLPGPGRSALSHQGV